MKRSSPILIVTFFAILLLARGKPLYAQDSSTTQEPDTQQPPMQSPTPEGSPPKPAGRGNPTFGEAPNADDASASMTPDSTALTGVQVPTLGAQELHHSYFVPGFQYGNFVRSSTLEVAPQPGAGGWNSTSFVAGNLSLLQQWSRAALTLNYTGGGTFSTDPILGNSQYHQLQAQQMFVWRHARLWLIDQFSYLPLSDFGFGAASPLGVAGIGGALGPALPALQNNYSPSQSIYSALGPRYSNSATAQIDYDLTSRSSVTISGSYGILRFVDPGNIQSDDSIFSFGYDYHVSKRDTLGVLFRDTNYRYLGNPQGINDYDVLLAYGRKLTGRAVLQVFVGPEVTQLRVPLNGATQLISVSGGANLRYAISRMNFGVSYNHGTSGGSGIFAGTTLDQLSGSVDRKLTRTWDADIALGYARNRSLGSQTAILPEPAIASWFANLGLKHPLGRSGTVGLAYGANIESQAGCSTACPTSTQHQISLSFQWHTSPIVIE
jgi:hypothetical protein